jgi:hypothetical protein
MADIGGASPDLPTADEKAALDGAPTALTALNPVASMADIGGAGMANPMTAGGDLIVGLIVPTLNVALQSSGATATASGTGSFTPDKVNDGNDGTYFDFNAGWLEIDLGVAQHVSGARVKDGASGDHQASVTVSYSTDNSTWYTADVHAMASDDDTWTFAAQTARYWRFTGSGYWGIYTIDIFAAVGTPGSPERLPAGTLGQVVTANPAATNGVDWETPGKLVGYAGAEVGLTWATFGPYTGIVIPIVIPRPGLLLTAEAFVRNSGGPCHLGIGAALYENDGSGKPGQIMGAGQSGPISFADGSSTPTPAQWAQTPLGVWVNAGGTFYLGLCAVSASAYIDLGQNGTGTSWDVTMTSDAWPQVLVDPTNRSDDALNVLLRARLL